MNSLRGAQLRHNNYTVNMALSQQWRLNRILITHNVLIGINEVVGISGRRKRFSFIVSFCFNFKAHQYF